MFDFFKKSKVQESLFYSTDIHSHMVPGVDDGSKNVETSTFIIRSLNQLGIKRMLITPHVTEATFENSRATLDAPFNRLKDNLKNENIDIDIMYSAEYRLDDFFENKVFKANDFLLLPNNFILIENSFIQQALNFDELVFELKMKGLIPILAHPERYKYYIQKRSRYKELHDSDLLLQVNLLSFSGYYGKDVKETAWWLLENNMVDFIGTDIHNTIHLEQIQKFITTKDYKKLSAKAEILNDTAFV
ncbi:MAG: hypothetical protein PHR45_02310 [Muribaculaceae bacterium]|nr:hypothetical protein [Muribaculaceae bacterium]